MLFLFALDKLGNTVCMYSIYIYIYVYIYIYLHCGVHSQHCLKLENKSNMTDTANQIRMQILYETDSIQRQKVDSEIRHFVDTPSKDGSKKKENWRGY